MASKRRMWELLAYLGHRGDRDAIIQCVFEAASRVTFRSEGDQPLDGGDYLVQVFESLSTTRDWPPCGGREWTRLRQIAVRKILARLAREGLLDAVSVGCPGEADHLDACGAAEAEGSGDGRRAPDGADACEETAAPEANGSDGMPGIGAEVDSAMLRRMSANAGCGFRCLKRDTPISIIRRWAK